MKLSPLILFSTAAVSLGGLLFGFDTAVIAGATRGISSAFHLNTVTLGVTVSCALWGTVVGGFFVSPLAQRYGARGGMRIMAILYLVSALGCALAWSWSSLLIFRLIGGLGIGGSSVLCPMYIAEIAPRRWRGRLVACFQFAVVLGILLAYASNFAWSHLAATPAEWRFDLGAAAIPAALFAIALRFIPESPRWLVAHGHGDEAAALLLQIGGSQQGDLLQPAEAISGRSALFTRKHRKLILIAISIGALNQLSGINAILYYLNDIFSMAGFSSASATVQAVAIGAANLLFTVLAMLLIDTMGRRFLLKIGSVGMAACLLSVGFVFATGRHRASLLWLLIAYIAFFAFSQGTVVWVYLSEIFPADIREKGQSLGTLAVWVTNGLVAAVFPFVSAISSASPFVFFALMMIVQLILTLLLFPETKGLSLKAAAGSLE